MTDLHTDILSAFCDGEAVDPDLLAAALADPRGRDALVDFARLRAAVALEGPLPASLARLRAPVRSRAAAWTVLAAAAAMVLLLAAAASLWPRAWLTRSGEQAPPAPTRVMSYQPGVDWHPLR